jgi:aspartate kinase
MNTHVIKVGGENASDPRTAEWLANFRSRWNKVAVAISALRTKPLNTTNELLRAKEVFLQEGMKSALPILENLYRVHIDTLKESWMYDSELEEELATLFDVYFHPDFRNVHNSFDNLLLTSELEKQFVWYGEVMSAHVLAHILQTRHQVATILLADIIEESPREKGLSTILKENIWRRVSENIENSLVIVPGYIGVTGHEFLPTYGRGYTDKMAERIAVGLADLGHTPTLHIQKQVPMYSSHPGHIDNVRSLWDISYWTAAEITGSRGANAQVLNEHTITRELTAKNIPIWVYNPFVVDAPKTTISESWSTESGIQFIDSRDHVSTITVSGFAMSWPGLLSQLTDLFARRSLSIDSISASETEVTFTTYDTLTDDEKNKVWSDIHTTLWDEYSIDIRNNIGMIYCIWDNLSGHPGLLEKITGTLAQSGIDIEYISQSRWQRAITIGVGSTNLREGVKVLHARLIENRD